MSKKKPLTVEVLDAEIPRKGRAGRDQADTPTPPKIALHTVDHVRQEMARVYREARGGLIEPAVATKLTFILDRIINAHTVSELERRIAELESGGAAESLPSLDGIDVAALSESELVELNRALTQLESLRARRPAFRLIASQGE